MVRAPRPGCITFDVSRSTEDPNVFVLYEEWRDQNALDVHYKSAHFEKYGINGIRVAREQPRPPIAAGPLE